MNYCSGPTYIMHDDLVLVSTSTYDKGGWCATWFDNFGFVSLNVDIDRKVKISAARGAILII